MFSAKRARKGKTKRPRASYFPTHRRIPCGQREPISTVYIGVYALPTRNFSLLPSWVAGTRRRYVVSLLLSFYLLGHNIALLSQDRAVLVPTESSLRELGSDPVEVYLTEEVTVIGTLRIPATARIRVGEGGQFYLADGADLIIEGPFSADPREVFFGEGQVRLHQGYARVEWFGARADGAFDPVTFEVTSVDHTPSYHPFRKAVQAVGPAGEVHFGPGVFIMEDTDRATRARFGRDRIPKRNPASIAFFTSFTDGSAEVYDSLRVTGEGIGVTYALSPAEDVGGVAYAPYRSSGWRDDANSLQDQATYTTEVHAGDSLLTLRSAAMAAQFAPGDRIFIRNGASVWDQDKGQPNVVKAVSGRQLLLEFPLTTEFTLEQASHAGTVGAFVQPPEGGLVQVTYLPVRGREKSRLGGADGTCTIGNDLYEVVSDDGGGRYTLRNVADKENAPAGTAIPDGSPVMKSRIVFPLTTTTRGAGLENMTVSGGRDGWQLSNYIDGYARKVEMLHRGSDSGGLTINGDGGLNFLMEQCVTRTRDGQFEGSQLARSTTNFRAVDCEWRGVKHSVVEFSAGTRWIRNQFYLDAVSREKLNTKTDKQGRKVRRPATNVAAMLVGETTGHNLFDSCSFFVRATGDVKAISSSDIGHYTAKAGGLTTFRNTYISVDGARMVFSIKSEGVDIQTMHVEGSAETLFGSLGPSPELALFPRSGALTTIDDFHFTGYVDQIFGQALYAVRVLPNSTVTRLGGTVAEKVNARRIVDGSLVTGTGPDGYQVSRIEVDLTVEGWPLVEGVDAIKFNGRLGSDDYLRFRLRNAERYRRRRGAEGHDFVDRVPASEISLPGDKR